jgi:hypothetical protein
LCFFIKGGISSGALKIYFEYSKLRLPSLNTKSFMEIYFSKKKLPINWSQKGSLN